MSNKELKRVPNPNGRPKGIPNKRSLEARAIFDEHGFDPIREAIVRLKDVQDAELYINTCVKLAKYYYPELKSIDHKFDPTKLSDQELIEETERLMKEVKGNA